MALEEKDVRHVAELAHLELTEEEVRKFLPQLDAVLAYVQKLNELDTTRVEPMAQVSSPAARKPAMRDDVTRRTLQEDPLANAPEQAAGSFKVPKVIERD